MKHGDRLRLGVLFSGGGRTLENLVEASRDPSFPAAVAVAISSHRGAGGLERARRLGVPHILCDYRELGEAMSAAMTRHLLAANVDLVCLAGFLRHYRYPAAYAGRVLNIHPSLLPAFGGKGLYGSRVHRAVLAADVRFSGCTVHFVSEVYDEGPIILQRVVPVRPDDTEDTLAARVFQEECVAYPEAIRLFARGLLYADGERVLIRGGDR